MGAERASAIVTNQVGTPTELITSDGRITWQARTSIWGASARVGLGEVPFALRFPGQYHDAETGWLWWPRRLPSRLPAPSPPDGKVACPRWCRGCRGVVLRWLDA